MLVSKPVLCKKRVLLKCLIGISLTTMMLPDVAHAALNIHGSLDYSYNLVKSESTQSQINSLGLNISGSSSIWQPWFATLSAGVGLGIAAGKGNGPTSPENKFTSNNVNLAFSVFPISRFPFQLTYTASRNEQENFSNSIDGVSTISAISRSSRLGFQQSYTTRDLTHFNLYYQIADFESEFNKYKNDIGGFRINKSYSRQRYSLDGTYVKTNQQKVGSESSSFSLSGTHSYYPGTEVGVSSLASSSITSSKSQSSPDEFKGNSNQVSSSISWRPRHKPYTASGSIRFTNIKRDDGSSAENTSNSVGTGGTMTYNFNRQTRGTLDMDVNLTEVNGRQSFLATQNATVGYFGNPFPIGGFYYNWNVGGSISNSTSKLDSFSDATGPVPDFKSSSQGIGASIGHSASKSWVFSSSNLNLGLSQSFSAARSFNDDPEDTGGVTPPSQTPLLDEIDDTVKSMSSGANFGVSNFSAGGSTLMNTQFTDGRTFANESNSFQMLTFTLSRNQGINRLSSASGNFFFQTSRTDDSSVETGAELIKSGSIRFAYQHVRAFGVYALVYKSRLKQDSFIVDTGTKKGNIEWLNTFTYAIGLLSTRLSMRWLQAPDGSRSSSFNFQATRSF